MVAPKTAPTEAIIIERTVNMGINNNTHPAIYPTVPLMNELIIDNIEITPMKALPMSPDIEADLMPSITFPDENIPAMKPPMRKKITE